MSDISPTSSSENLSVQFFESNSLVGGIEKYPFNTKELAIYQKEKSTSGSSESLPLDPTDTTDGRDKLLKERDAKQQKETELEQVLLLQKKTQERIDQLRAKKAEKEKKKKQNELEAKEEENNKKPSRPRSGGFSASPLEHIKKQNSIEDTDVLSKSPTSPNGILKNSVDRTTEIGPSRSLSSPRKVSFGENSSSESPKSVNTSTPIPVPGSELSNSPGSTPPSEKSLSVSPLNLNASPSEKQDEWIKPQSPKFKNEIGSPKIAQRRSVELSTSNPEKSTSILGKLRETLSPRSNSDPAKKTESPIVKKQSASAPTLPSYEDLAEKVKVLEQQNALLQEERLKLAKQQEELKALEEEEQKRKKEKKSSSSSHKSSHKDKKDKTKSSDTLHDSSISKDKKESKEKKKSSSSKGSSSSKHKPKDPGISMSPKSTSVHTSRTSKSKPRETRDLETLQTKEEQARKVNRRKEVRRSVDVVKLSRSAPSSASFKDKNEEAAFKSFTKNIQTQFTLDEEEDTHGAITESLHLRNDKLAKLKQYKQQLETLSQDSQFLSGAKIKSLKTNISNAQQACEDITLGASELSITEARQQLETAMDALEDFIKEKKRTLVPIGMDVASFASEDKSAIELKQNTQDIYKTLMDPLSQLSKYAQESKVYLG